MTASADQTAFMQLAAHLDAIHPAFRAAHHLHLAEWSAGELKVVELACYAGALLNLATAGQEMPVRRFLAGVEEALRAGDEGITTAVCTGLLEAIVHRAEGSGFDLRSIAEHLGPGSRAYLRSWDEFCDVRTPGLEASHDA